MNNFSKRILTATSVLVLLFTLIEAKKITAQICTPAPNGLVSWWAGDGNANDTQSNNHGSLQNGVVFTSGLSGQAFKFDGIDDFVHIPNSPSLMVSGGFTIEFWFNPTVTVDPLTPNAPGFFSKGTYNSIDLSNNDGRLEVRGPERPNSTTNTWFAGNWYHVAITFDTINYKVYINGVQEGGITSNYSILNNTDDILLGSIGLANTTFNGLIDEVSLYNRALNATEIQAILNSNSVGKCKLIEVGIDIKPNSFPNNINLSSNGTTPVAIFSSTNFDATTINPTTVSLAGVQVRLKRNGTPMVSFEDINTDGLLDMILRISTRDMQLNETDIITVLNGQTFNGMFIKGTDLVRIVH